MREEQKPDRKGGGGGGGRRRRKRTESEGHYQDKSRGHLMKKKKNRYGLSYAQTSRSGMPVGVPLSPPPPPPGSGPRPSESTSTSSPFACNKRLAWHACGPCDRPRVHGAFHGAMAQRLRTTLNGLGRLGLAARPPLLPPELARRSWRGRPLSLPASASHFHERTSYLTTTRTLPAIGGVSQVQSGAIPLRPSSSGQSQA
ncbi:hypothetical protein BD289DRAFT_202971 [Coniella lustricola]|uniref:Uncharacterized protein n=1 Tax=Coniella lustricola TaxID=2025994 RepID=A0A2T2ZSF9_9PEZI|nr:hypothetical protein BD289DRAFT_202971 [Coniella lustricola]